MHRHLVAASFARTTMALPRRVSSDGQRMGPLAVIPPHGPCVLCARTDLSDLYRNGGDADEQPFAAKHMLVWKASMNCDGNRMKPKLRVLT